MSVKHAWGLDAPTSTTTPNGHITIQAGQTWWPKQDLIIPANHPVTVSFSPSKPSFSIQHFYVGAEHPANQGTITFRADTHSQPIPENTIITLTPSNGSQANGYHFTWHTVQSGLAQVIKAGTYVVNVQYPDHNITALPNDVTVIANRSINVVLNDQPYPGSLVFSLNHHQPISAPDVTIHISDETAHTQYTLSLPWDNHAQTYQNLPLNHHYRFHADDITAANTLYHFTFTPSDVTLTAQTKHTPIHVTTRGSAIPTYPIHFIVSGLPKSQHTELMVANQAGAMILKTTIANGEINNDLPVGTYQIKASTIFQQGFHYAFNQGNAKTISVTQDSNQPIPIPFVKTTSGYAVSGWPSYISMGAVTDANTHNPQQLTNRDVDAIFKYAGDGGNGDPGKIVFPIYTYNTMALAHTLSQTNHHTVKPVMVVYTAEMSGGTAYKDLDNLPNLSMHFVNLMLVAQTLQSGQNAFNEVGSIVLNPDLLGMVQQQKLYNKATGALGPLNTITVQAALAKAYWFITTPHTWSLTLNSGKTITIDNATPEEVIQKAVKGELKPFGVYSPWDIKTAWEAEAKNILNHAPSHLVVHIPHFDDDFKGWIQATNWAIKATGSEVTFGWQENVWNVESANWVHKPLSPQQVEQEISAPTAELWQALHVYDGQYKPDFLVFDKYEMDPIPAAAGIGYVWNARDWDHYLTYVKQLSTALNNAPVMLWQIPGGHLQLTNGIDKRHDHGATAPDYFFGDLQLAPNLTNIKAYIQAITLPSGPYHCESSACQMTQYLSMDQYTWHNSNMQKAKDSHVFSILWGGGNTTSVGTFPQNDGGWLANKVNAYEQHPTDL